MTRFTFDPLSQGFTRNPYETYTILQQSNQPLPFDAMNCLLLSRYEDVESAARNPVMVRSLESFASPEEIKEAQIKANFHDMPHHEQFVQFSMLERDGELHRRMRMVVLREFSKQLVERHRDMIQEHVNSLLGPLIEQREFDFIEDLAAKIPGHVIGKLLGVPDEDCAQLRIWSENIVQYFDADRTEANKQLAENATRDFYYYLTGLIEVRRRTPTSDLITTLIAATDRGDLNEQELISTCMLILAGGHGSTIDVLGTGLLALISHPDQLRMLQDDPRLMPSAVQEMFRYESPLPFFHRYASQAVEVMGQQYPTGTKFGLLYGAANRDPRQFPNAQTFDITRTENRHVAFGRGAHLCLGNNLARLDMEIIFNNLLRKVKAIEVLSDEPDYRPGLSSRGLTKLSVRLTCA